MVATVHLHILLGVLQLAQVRTFQALIGMQAEAQVCKSEQQ
jgi:hypothetical protein